MKGHVSVYFPTSPSPTPFLLSHPLTYSPMPLPPQGTHVWLADNGQWIPAVVTAATAAEVTFTSPYGQVPNTPTHTACCI